MVYWKKQETKKIISLSVIIHYIHYCHPNKNVINIQGHLWLWMLYIYQDYTFLMTIIARLSFKKINDQRKMLKTEGLVKKKIAYMKHIKIRSCNMGVIFMPKHLIRKKSTICEYPQSDHVLKCVMRYCSKVQAFIFLTKKQMIIIPTLVHQLVFTFII